MAIATFLRGLRTQTQQTLNTFQIFGGFLSNFGRGIEIQVTDCVCERFEGGGYDIQRNFILRDLTKPVSTAATPSAGNSRISLIGSQQLASGTMGVERTAPLDDDSKKQINGSAAAEVAAKLAANTSSAAMLTSVLSSLAAEEARTPVALALDVPNLGRPLDKRQRIDSRPDGSDQVQSFTLQSSHQQQTHQRQLPQPPPVGQYLQQPIMSMQFGYGTLPPPPPLQSHPMLQMPRIGAPPQLLPPGCGTQQPPFQPLQPPMGFYNSPPLPAPPAPIRPQ